VLLRAYAVYVRKGYRIFTVSTEDINTALQGDVKLNLEALLPAKIRHYASVFLPKEAE
jgi:hypothetical protein